MLVLYARVSTIDLQRDALTKAGCERLFEEKRSRKAGTKRPEFGAALAYLRPEDVLVAWKLDRLGRSLVEMMRTIDGLRVKVVHFRSLTEQFDSATAHGRFALKMHGAMTEDFLDLNLATLYQRCHMIHDQPEHRRRRWFKLFWRKAMGDLFRGPYH